MADQKQYTYYGDQYDYNDLRKRADEGLLGFLSTFKQGRKHSEDYQKAYQNIISGIGDGTITFDGGKFHDSSGRYTNSGKGNDDHYGIMAKYIWDQMKRGKSIQKEEEKPTGIEYDNGKGLSQLASEMLFGPFGGDVRDFIDQDQIVDGVRGNTNRISAIRTMLTGLKDKYQTGLHGFTDEQRDRDLANIDAAIQAIDANGFGNDDYLALRRAVGIDWRNLLRDNYDTEESTTQDTKQTSTEAEQQQRENDFRDYVQSRYVRDVNDDYIWDLSFNDRFGEYTSKRYSDALSQLGNNQLQSLLINALRNPLIDFGTYSIFRRSGNTPVTSQWVASNILRELNKRGKLIQDSENSNIYYIPGISDQNSSLGYYYDSSTGSIYRKNKQDIPYYQKQIYNEWAGIDPRDSWIDNMFVVSEKKGGVLKAQTGVKLGSNYDYYGGIFSYNLPYIISQLKAHGQGYAQWLNDMQSRHSEIANMAGDNWQNQTYSNDLVKQYQDLYKSGYNNEFKSNLAGYNSIGIENARSQGMFDISGPTRNSGDWANKEWTSDGLFSGITDSRRLLGRVGDFTDEQLVQITKQFKDAGFDFVAGNDNYYRVVPLEQAVQPATEVMWDPNLEAPKTDFEDGTNLPAGTDIFGKDVSNGGNAKGALASAGIVALGELPKLLATGRMIAAKKNNNKIAQTLKDVAKPVLEDTYQLVSPIHGAYSEMRMKDRQAADVRNMAARPRTSDAALQLAGQLSANRQATDLQYQGFWADDRKIQQTMDKAWEVQVDNTKRSSDVANKNRKAINESNREIAQIEASRLKANWQSKDNYLKGLEQGMQNISSRIKQAMQADSMARLENDHSYALSQLMGGKDKSELLKDSNFVEKARQLSAWKQMQKNRILYGNGAYSPQFSISSLSQILS